MTTAGSPVIAADGVVVSALNAAATTLEGRNVFDVRFSFPAVVPLYVVRLGAIVSAIPPVLDDASPRDPTDPTESAQGERKGEANRACVTRAVALWFPQSFRFSPFYILLLRLIQLRVNLSHLIRFPLSYDNRRKSPADRSTHRKHVEALHFHVRVCIYMYIYIQLPTHVISSVMSFHVEIGY